MSSEFNHGRWVAWRKSQLNEGGNAPEGWITVSRNLIESGALVTQAYLDASTIALRNVLRGGPDTDERTPEEEAVVRRGLQTFSVGLMLFGFAIECLLKALYLRRGGKLYIDGIFQRPKGMKKSHNLAEWAHALGCAELFTDEQLDVLDLLSAQNEMGRYPAHTRYDDYGLQPGLGADGLARFYGIWDAGKSAKIFGALKVLFRNLGEEVPHAAQCLLDDLRIQCAAYQTPFPSELAD